MTDGVDHAPDVVVGVREGSCIYLSHTQGGRFGGWGLLLLNDKPLFVHALSNQSQHKYKVASNEKLLHGKHSIRFDFRYDSGGIGKGGMGTLSVDGKQVAQSHIERTVCCRFSLDETFDVGADTGSPVIEDYDSQMPFRFTGTLEKLTIELAPQSMRTEDQRELERRQLAGAIATE